MSAAMGRYRQPSRDISPYLQLFPDIPRSCQPISSYRGVSPDLGGYPGILRRIRSYPAIAAHVGGYGEILPAHPEIFCRISSYFGISRDLARYLQLSRRISRSWRISRDLAAYPLLSRDSGSSWRLTGRHRRPSQDVPPLSSAISGHPGTLRWSPVTFFRSGESKPIG
jgi:hypothetical protein